MNVIREEDWGLDLACGYEKAQIGREKKTGISNRNLQDVENQDGREIEEKMTI